MSIKDNKQNASNLLYKIIEKFRSISNTEKVLILDCTSISSSIKGLEVFDTVDTSEFSDEIIRKDGIIDIKNIETKHEKYDLVLSILPFVKYHSFVSQNKIDADKSLPIYMLTMLGILELMNDNGIYLSLVLPNFFYSKDGYKFEKIINERGYSIEFALNLPKDFLKHIGITFSPIIVGIRKRKDDRLFIADVQYENDLESIISNYVYDKSSTIANGLWLRRHDFSTFSNYKTNKLIEELNSQYKNYESKTLSEVALAIHSIREGKYQEVENAIYIPKLGVGLPKTNLSEVKINHFNCYQVVLNGEKVLSSYLENFFKSEYGRLLSESLKKTSIIPHINILDLSNIKLPIPSIEIQESIVSTSNKIRNLEMEIKKFDLDLSLNPNNVEEVDSVLNRILETLGRLNEADSTLSTIRNGESKYVEFKQTFRKDVKTNIKEKEESIKIEALKTIVGFLNADGGTLLIGVNDDGKVYGIENDYYENEDKYKLNFKNNIKDRIGEEYYPFVDWKIVKINNLRVLKVDCKKSDKACYLDKKDFYVRTDPSTDKLEGPELEKYIYERFYK